MRRTIWLLAGVLLSGVALGSDSPKEYDGKLVKDDLQGTWRMVAHELGGEKLTVDWVALQTFRGDRYIYFYDGQIEDEGIYTANKGRSIASLDLTSASNKRMVKYIFCKLDGDMLRTASKWNGGRPERFDENGLVISIWKRVK